MVHVSIRNQVLSVNKWRPEMLAEQEAEIYFVRNMLDVSCYMAYFISSFEPLHYIENFGQFNLRTIKDSVGTCL